ncbi:MAG TPA: 3-hydroxyacyl-ACP dehydratase FabZ family protein [Fimbriiglobus sp.]|jgi:3-hydroxyacyl-[acyl-carrier-protein] dehydratase
MPAENDHPEIELNGLDFSNCIADLAAIHAVNPHRFGMEMLTGIVALDPARKIIVGYKDIRADEFWVPGHMPGFPLFPGVLMLEAAAQLCGYYVVSQKVVPEGSLMGLAGVDEARFIRAVRPGERLVLVGRGERLHRRLNKFRVTGYVGEEKAFESLVTGVTLGQYEDMKGA